MASSCSTTRQRGGLRRSPPTPPTSDSSTLITFTGRRSIVGNYNGFPVSDVADPTDPRSRRPTSAPAARRRIRHGHLLFTSVEQGIVVIDSGTQGACGAVDPEHFQGVRIFDISAWTTRCSCPAFGGAVARTTRSRVTDPDDPETSSSSLGHRWCAPARGASRL